MSDGASSSCFNPMGLDVSATNSVDNRFISNKKRVSSAGNRRLRAREEPQFWTAEGSGLGSGQPEAMRARWTLQSNKQRGRI